MPDTISLTCAYSASVSGKNLLISVIEFAVLSLTLTVFWFDTSGVDSGHTAWTFTSVEWSNFARFFHIRVF